MAKGKRPTSLNGQIRQFQLNLSETGLTLSATRDSLTYITPKPIELDKSYCAQSGIREKYLPWPYDVREKMLDDVKIIQLLPIKKDGIPFDPLRLTLKDIEYRTQISDLVDMGAFHLVREEYRFETLAQARQKFLELAVAHPEYAQQDAVKDAGERVLLFDRSSVKWFEVK